MDFISHSFLLLTLLATYNFELARCSPERPKNNLQTRGWLLQKRQLIDIYSSKEIIDVNLKRLLLTEEQKDYLDYCVKTLNIPQLHGFIYNVLQKMLSYLKPPNSTKYLVFDGRPLAERFFISVKKLKEYISEISDLSISRDRKRRAIKNNILPVNLGWSFLNSKNLRQLADIERNVLAMKKKAKIIFVAFVLQSQQKEKINYDAKSKTERQLTDKIKELIKIKRESFSAAARKRKALQSTTELPTISTLSTLSTETIEHMDTHSTDNRQDSTTEVVSTLGSIQTEKTQVTSSTRNTLGNINEQNQNSFKTPSKNTFDLRRKLFNTYLNSGRSIRASTESSTKASNIKEDDITLDKENLNSDLPDFDGNKITSKLIELSVKQNKIQLGLQYIYKHLLFEIVSNFIFDLNQLLNSDNFQIEGVPRHHLSVKVGTAVDVYFDSYESYFFEPIHICSELQCVKLLELKKNYYILDRKENMECIETFQIGIDTYYCAEYRYLSCQYAKKSSKDCKVVKSQVIPNDNYKYIENLLFVTRNNVTFAHQIHLDLTERLALVDSVYGYKSSFLTFLHSEELAVYFFSFHVIIILLLGTKLIKSLVLKIKSYLIARQELLNEKRERNLFVQKVYSEYKKTPKRKRRMESHTSEWPKTTPLQLD